MVVSKRLSAVSGQLSEEWLSVVSYGLSVKRGLGNNLPQFGIFRSFFANAEIQCEESISADFFPPTGEMFRKLTCNAGKDVLK